MVEAGGENKGGARDVWKEQRDKAGKKRKHQRAFGNGGKMNWADKKRNKKERQAEQAAGRVDHYEISTYKIGSDKFNEYYKVS